MVRHVLLTCVMFILAAPFAQAQDKEAEKLFHTMQEKITAARSIKFIVELQKSAKKGDGKQLRVAVWLSERNKLRCEYEIPTKGDMVAKVLRICDGTKVLLNITDPELGTFVDFQKPRAEFTKEFLDYLANPGMLVAFEVICDTWPHEKIGLVNSNYQLGGIEKVGDREVRVVHYILKETDMKPERLTKITIWVDTQTSLPLKRVMAPAVGADWRIEELYSGWQVDSKIDPKLFELPK
jgi:outer membrane lipoprotein-sorting protein